MKVSKREQIKTFRIRDFSDDSEFDTVEELVRELKQSYRGRSVAVHVKTQKYGMVRPFFVDVRENGDIVESYGESGNEAVHEDQFRAAACG